MLTPSSSADAVHLRRLLDILPTCVIRVRLDGSMLACNAAGLNLLAAETLASVLDTNLADRIATEDRAKWHEFTARVWAKGAASLEVRIAVDGDARPVVVRGVAITDHPDGVESLLLNLRDASPIHRLEHAVRSAEVRRAAEEQRGREMRDQV